MHTSAALRLLPMSSCVNCTQSANCGANHLFTLQVRKESERDRRVNEAIAQLKAQYKDRELGSCMCTT